jgi:hypothetical protein
VDRRTAYWCCRCKRRLANDRTLKPMREDTVTPFQPPKGDIEYTHDGCGGVVLPEAGTRQDAVQK